MINAPIVLVLGAGASQPYGFPLGIGLVDLIAERIHSGLTSAELTEFMVLGHDSARLRDFASALRAARPYSIDAFLETREEFRKIGKAAIAHWLLQAEAAGGLQAAPAKVDWYRYLLNRFLLLRNTSYFLAQARHLTIVTFNFDRSFERALFVGVQAGFGLTDAAAAKLVMNIQIHHVHGTLGDPSWLNPSGPNVTDYGAQDVEAVKTAIGRIKIVDEEIERVVVEDVKAALKQAVFVYFIGFGFDERNLEKLGTPQSISNAAIVRGTAFEWTGAEQSPVGRHFGRSRIILYPAADAIGFLREHAEALFE